MLFNLLSSMANDPLILARFESDPESILREYRVPDSQRELLRRGELELLVESVADDARGLIEKVRAARIRPSVPWPRPPKPTIEQIRFHGFEQSGSWSTEPVAEVPMYFVVTARQLDVIGDVSISFSGSNDSQAHVSMLSGPVFIPPSGDGACSESLEQLVGGRVIFPHAGVFCAEVRHNDEVGSQRFSVTVRKALVETPGEL